MGKSKLNTIKFPLEKYLNLFILQFNFFGSLLFSIYLILTLYFLNLKFVALNILISTIIATVIVSIIRLVFRRERPNKQTYNNIFEKIDSSSFPSMHALRTSIYTTVFLISNLYALSIIFLIILLFVLLSRYIMKKHYISDLIVGVIFGISITIIIDLILHSFSFSF